LGFGTLVVGWTLLPFRGSGLSAPTLVFGMSGVYVTWRAFLRTYSACFLARQSSHSLKKFESLGLPHPLQTFGLSRHAARRF